MKKLLKILPYLIGLLALTVACEKSDPDIPDEIDIVSEKYLAKTTDTLEFEIETIPVFSKRSTFFYRWDWENDSTWDTRYSQLSQIKHRFFTPGEFQVKGICSNGKGSSVTSVIDITIEQGYSKPNPLLSVAPETGNYTAEFLFDASKTFDFEDSLWNLEFRWDMVGDGYWAYPYDTLKIIRHTYNRPGTYHPVVEVRDPSGLVASKSFRLDVHKRDTLIDIKVEWENERIASGDLVVFDVSKSVYRADPDRDFQVSWIRPYTLYWTDPTYEKTLAYTFKAEGDNVFKCKLIMDKTGLENELEFSVFAAEENLPPEPAFEVSINYGNINTQFYFNAWHSRDDHTTPSKLLLRFDWDADGSWDTPYSKEKEYYHQYYLPGQYGVIMEAKDEKGLTAKAYTTLHVSPNKNPTDIIRDTRDENIYGTVRIGELWWMAENLRFTVPQKTESGLYTSLCLFESDSWCEQVGKLYQVSAINIDRFDDKFIQVCPNGWRIPTKEDWENLISTIGGTSRVDQLLIGGDTDFNGRYLGLGDYSMVGFPVPTDTIYEFLETFESMYYPSSTIPVDINETRTDTYVIKVSKEGGSFWSGYMRGRYYMPVRCVKE